MYLNLSSNNFCFEKPYHIFKNLKETNKIEVKKNFKKIYKKNHALEKLGSP